MSLIRKKDLAGSFTLFHTNIESLPAKEERLRLLTTIVDLKFDVIALTETWNSEDKKHLFMPPTIEGYLPYEGITGSTMKGGCGFYIRNTIDYIPRKDLDHKFYKMGSEFECKWIEIIKHKK